MTQEDKDLLLKDLCSRVPYGVKLKCFDLPKNPCDTKERVDLDCKLKSASNNLMVEIDHWGSYKVPIEKVKPYLRPMSSLVGKELDECRATCKYRQVGQSVLDCATPETIDYLISHHFDYRGLIPMGLALEAPKDMYKTE